MNELSKVYRHKGMLIQFEKGRNSDACYHMDETGKHYDKWNKPDINMELKWQILHCVYFTSRKEKERREKEKEKVVPVRALLYLEKASRALFL